MTGRDVNPPGFKWILYVGVAGFLAGFVGPMIMAPSSNIGPLIGIIYTGPAAFVVGAALWAICAVFKPAPRFQWRALYSIVSIGTLAIVLSIHPEPAWKGFVFEGRVASCDRPADLEEDVLDHWHERIAQVHWESPRAGWESGMRSTLRAAPGVVVTVRFERRNAIRQHRKWWNKSEYPEGWQDRDDEVPFYFANGTCDPYPKGSEIRGYQRYEFTGPKPPGAGEWPPRELLRILRADELDAIPEKWQEL